MRKKDVPCAGGCGELIWRGNGCLPPGQAMCQPCRRKRREAAEGPRACSGCGDMFVPTWSGGKLRTTCSDGCRYAAMRNAPRAPMEPKRRACEVCGVRYKYTYSKQRTCGRACGAKINSRIVNACGRQKPVRPAPPEKLCPECQTVFADYRGKYCSKSCRTSAKRRYDAVYNATMRPTAWDRSPRVCTRCSEQFMPNQVGQAYCTSACMKSARRRRERDAGTRWSDIHRERAKKYGRKYERVSPKKVFDRDAWVCQLCRKPVPKGKKAPHPLSPTLDHIIPMSVEGGDHVYENVQLAHFICNAKRGTGGVVQLLLLG